MAEPTVTSNVPVPDPTVLTTQLVDRALRSYRDVVDTRLEASDTATRLQADQLERLRGEVDRHLKAQFELVLEKINHVADVASEKFVGIDRRFSERDDRVKQAAAESAVSLNAALAAQSASVAQQNTANATASNKQEAAFQKLLDQQSATHTAEYKSLADQFADMKDRLTRAETAAATRLTTQTEVKTESRLNMNMVILALGIVLAAITLVLGLPRS